MIVSDFDTRTPGYSESQKRGQQAGLATRREMAKRGDAGIATDYVEWYIPYIDRVSVAEFERSLVAQYGPEYLEPVNYHRVDGALVPIKEVIS